jgi:hypothetical protein
LFYRAFAPPVFFASGSAPTVQALLDQAPLPSNLYLHIKPKVLYLVRARYRRVTTKVMQRMILREAALADVIGTEIIPANGLPELVELYNCRTAQEKAGTFFAYAADRWSLLRRPLQWPVGRCSRNPFDQPG